MARVEALSREGVSELEPLLEAIEEAMGFVPNSLLTMARKPDLVRAFAELARTILGPASPALSAELRQMVALVASRAAGCRYCQAHTAHSAARAGAVSEKLRATWDFESSPLFEPAERAALRLARDAALVPNQATDEHFHELARHFDEDAILEIVAVVSLFGFLNRWNDTLATRLEEEPRAFAADTLSPVGWEPDKHD